MKVFLDCELTQDSRAARLISLALVSECCKEFYVELTDTYAPDDCSEFAVEHVLPKLNALKSGARLAVAQHTLRQFIEGLGPSIQVCTAAPYWDWKHFCALLDPEAGWPANLDPEPLDVSQLNGILDLRDIAGVAIPDIPHHALLDARILAELHKVLVNRLPMIVRRNQL